MSNLSTEVFGDMNFLYEHIATKENEKLNENSEYYDEEFAELVENIISTISLSMVYEGYSAEGILSFLADFSEEDIVERYLNFDENILTESVVPEEYIVEQLDIFDNAISEGLGTVIGRVAKGAASLAGRIVSKPARMKVAQKLMTSTNPARTGKAVDRLARMKLNKAGAPADVTKGLVDAAPNISTKARLIATAPVMGKVVKGVQKVKDIARGAKAALTGSTAKKIGLGAAALGAATGAGYIGGKMSGAGGGQGSSPAIAKSTGKPSDNFMQGSSLAKLGGREGRVKGGEFRSINWTQQSRDRYNAANPSTKPTASAASTPSAPSGSGGGSAASSGGGGGGAGTRAPSAARASSPSKASSATKAKETGKTPAGETPMQTWARTNPKLAAKVKLGQSGYDEISAKRTVPGPYEKQDQTPTTGPEPTEAQKTQAGSDVAAYQAAEKERFNKKQKEVAALTQKESYDAYDLVIEYLLHTGHADTISEAEYVISNFDSDMLDTLIESTAIWIENL
jgi:hypothetical protein